MVSKSPHSPGTNDGFNLQGLLKVDRAEGVNAVEVRTESVQVQTVRLDILLPEHVHDI